MARLSGEPYNRVYAAADQFREACLCGDGSLLFPGQTLWTGSNLKSLDEAMDNQRAPGNFRDRFRRQLAQMTPEIQRLAGEVVLVQYLFPSDFKFASKVRSVKEALGELSQDTLQLPVIQALDGGIGGANPGFNLFRYLDMKALISIFRAVKQLPGQDRKALLEDPWRFQATIDALPDIQQRGARHALLHILFPDAFERIASTGQKLQIFGIFRARIEGQPDQNQDRNIFQIRMALEQERGAGFDFYDDPVLRAQWQPDNTVVEADPDETAFYWLNAPTTLGPLQGRLIGTRVQLPQLAPSGKPYTKASCFTGAKAGDQVAGYEIGPRMELTTLLQVVQPLQEQPEGPCLELEIIGYVEPGIPLEHLRTSPHFTSMGSLINRGVLSKISQAQFKGLTGTEEQAIEIAEPGAPVGSQPREELFVDSEEIERWVELWRTKKNLILQGPPGVGKTFLARHLAKALTGSDDPARIQTIQFHQAYGYEDFVMGYRPNKDGGFEIRKGFFHLFRDAAMAENAPFVLIIDEINRGNLSKIFGETLMLIEADKRKERYALRLALHQDEDPKFFIPSNLYVLGLMNNSDRSLAVVDYALRRRFAFVNLRPAFDSEYGRDALAASLRAKGAENHLIARIIARVQTLNEVIAADLRNLGPDLCLGHSFFCGISSEQDYLDVIDHEIAPLLREYWFDNLEQADRETQKLRA